jgi:hypothetical protein
MKHRVAVTEEAVREVLEGFAAGGLVRTFAPPPETTPATDSEDEWAGRSPADHARLVNAVVERFCPRFVPGGTVVYIGDAEDKFLHLEAEYLRSLGVTVPAPAKMPDVVVHDTGRNWLLLIEAVTSAGPVDGKRRKELKELFTGCKAGLVFATAFASRAVLRSFLGSISWETEVWIADEPDHMMHFDGERFLGPYPDVAAPATVPVARAADRCTRTSRREG